VKRYEDLLVVAFVSLLSFSKVDRKTSTEDTD